MSLAIIRVSVLHIDRDAGGQSSGLLTLASALWHNALPMWRAHRMSITLKWFDCSWWHGLLPQVASESLIFLSAPSCLLFGSISDSHHWKWNQCLSMWFLKIKDGGLRVVLSATFHLALSSESWLVVPNPVFLYVKSQWHCQYPQLLLWAFGSTLHAMCALPGSNRPCSSSSHNPFVCAVTMAL